jgi:hypothetical protein
MICKHHGSHCKSNEDADIDITKWIAEMLPKASQTLAKACHCPRELL